MEEKLIGEGGQLDIYNLIFIVLIIFTADDQQL